jgi:hypothetical protein
MSNQLIPVEFHSYRDDLRYQSWPRAVCCRPMVGDLVQSNSGKYGQIHTICHIVESGDVKLRIELIEI